MYNKKCVLNIHIAFFLLFSYLSTTNGQTNTDSLQMKFDLGEVVVKSNHIIHTGANINSDNINKAEKYDVAEALNLMPGVLNAQGRKEDMIYVRGFNLRQVPVYLDGIPIGLPYDGFLDLDMMLATSLSEINVVSGTNALLYGPNALGGAINMISSRPAPGFTGKIKAGTFTNGKYNALGTFGYAKDKFYTLVSYAKTDKDNYRLSDDYTPNSDLEDGGDLENSYKKNSQLNLKYVFTPNKDDQYAIVYSGNWGEKGIPPYLGTLGTTPRYWQFPKYNKHSLYFLSDSKLSNSSSLKTRVYFDKFDDKLLSFDDNTYSTQTKGYAFTDYYDDYSYGIIATYSYLKNNNSLNIDGQYKMEDHKEQEEGAEAAEMADQSISFSVLDYYYYNKFVFNAGASLQYMNSAKAQYFDEDDILTDFPENENTVLNGELGVKYDFSESNTVKFGVAYKTRFPTMKDRYSQRFGTSLPNPDLKEENSLNYTLDYAGNLNNKWVINAGVFYSKLNDAITEVYGVDETDATIYQLQNAAEAEYFGGDVSVLYAITKPLTIQANYSYVERNNISSPDVKFTYVPNHTFQANINYYFNNMSYINLNTDSYSSRYVTSTGDKIDGYTLLNAKGACGFLKEKLVIEAGINNLMDKNYEVSEGYPMPGRNFYTSVILSF